MSFHSSLLSLGLLFISHALVALASLDCSPSSFASILPSNTTVTLAAPIGKFGSFSQNGVNVSVSHHNVTADTLPVCVVELQIQSSSNSTFHTGILLPSAWNGRLMATGNPGFGGGLRWAFQSQSLRYGPYVTVSTDTGHVGAPDDIDWTLGNPESVIDWAYRSLHESTVLAKMVAQAYYGTAVQKSYYTACSNGGRQGLKEVQMFPGDYDGVLAGAPPWQITHLHPWAVQMGVWNLPDNSSSHIETTKFGAIADLIMDQCDGQDGLVDGIIQQPYSCNFNSEAIMCNDTTVNTTTCLTADQITTLSHFYNDWTAPNGSLLFTRFPLSASASRYGEVTTKPDHFGLEYLYGFVFNNTNYDWSSFNGEQVIDMTNDLNTGDAAALETDLSAFKDRGGKLIMYHGLADTTIPTGSSIEYIQRVNETMDGTDDFMRLYLIPGMGHCGGSEIAPYYIAAAGQTVNSAEGFGFSVPGYADPQHDVLLALIAWVENSTAPASIIATKWFNDTLENGITLQRPLCPFPQTAVWDGKGNYTLATSWNCAEGSNLAIPMVDGAVGTVKAVNTTSGGGGNSSANSTTGECDQACQDLHGGNTTSSNGGKKNGAGALRMSGQQVMSLLGWIVLGATALCVF